jgi:hypothetical protein
VADPAARPCRRIAAALLAGTGLIGWGGVLAEVTATPHSGMLSGPTARTWWEQMRTSFGYKAQGPAVTPGESEVDRTPEEVEDEEAEQGRKPAGPQLSPVQRQAVQGVVAEYVIYLKYLSVKNFKDGPVDWRMERFQYASIVPLKDLKKPNAPFRVSDERIDAALDDMEDILVEVGEPVVALVSEALKNDLLYEGGAGRRMPPIDYRTPAGVQVADYNVQALERFDDIAYKLGNYQGWVPGTSTTFELRKDYRDRTKRILLRIGRDALPAIGKHQQAGNPAKVREYFIAVSDAIRAGEVPVRKGKAVKEFQPPPLDPAEQAKAAAQKAADAQRAALYKLWQEAEVAREAKETAKALKLYRAILEQLKTTPVPNYKDAALERIKELTAPKPAPEPKKDDGAGGGEDD